METGFHDLLLLYYCVFGLTWCREHPTQPGRGPGPFGGGGRFWLLLVVANQLQKGEPMSSPAWDLHFPLSSPVIFTATEEETGKEEKDWSGLRNTGVEITAC